MPTLADSLVSASARKLRIRKRPDLSAQKQRYLGRNYWVVKDPVGLHYFRFQDEEYAILNMLDGETSLDEIKEQFEARFPPQKITLEELQQFLGMLHRSSLVVAGVPGQGKQLLKRSRERRRQQLLQTASNVLSIRFKGIDPERFLNATYPYVRWFFSPLVFVLVLLLGLSAAMLVLVEFDVFRSKLPDFYQFFTPTNALWLAVTLGVTKVLHEFGHAYSCKHFGGECHEMGVMILVLTPCLYCNVSDSWMLPNKWRRAAIGAAGMYVEVVLASVATFLWWFSEPGLLNHLCLNVMFICSVSTIVFNGNPLLRFDGYYILADLMEIPNLRQKATTILSRKAGYWFLGLEQPDDPFLPERNQLFFAAYSVAAAVYRWVVVFGILFFLYHVFKPYRLEVIGQAFILASAVGLFVMPLYKLGKFFYVPGRWDKVKKPRMYLSLAGLGLIVAAFLFVPLPYHVMATLEVQPLDAQPVFVQVPGKLEWAVETGKVVKQGDELARLSDIALDLEIARLKTQRDEQAANLKSLQWRQYRDETAAKQIPAAEERRAMLDQQLREKTVDKSKLVLRAPRDGTVLPPPWVKPKPGPEGQLPSWQATPLEPRNRGCYLKQADLFCFVGDPKSMEAVLVIDQADIDFVRKKQTVHLRLDELPHESFYGRIRNVASKELEYASQRLSGKSGGALATKTDPNTGMERPMSASYQASVPISDTEGLLRSGLRGQGKIYMDWAGWQTLGQRLWRYLTRTFHFQL